MLQNPTCLSISATSPRIHRSYLFTMWIIFKVILYPLLLCAFLCTLLAVVALLYTYSLHYNNVKNLHKARHLVMDKKQILDETTHIKDEIKARNPSHTAREVVLEATRRDIENNISTQQQLEEKRERIEDDLPCGKLAGKVADFVVLYYCQKCAEKDPSASTKKSTVEAERMTESGNLISEIVLRKRLELERKELAAYVKARKTGLGLE